MPTYLVLFVQQHEEFRLPELESLARLENIKLGYEKDSYRLDSPFLKIELESDNAAERLVKRAILVKKIYELWGEGENYEALHDSVKRRLIKPTDFQGKSFKFVVSGFGFSSSAAQQLKIVNSFSYLSTNLDGPVNLQNPDLTFGVLENYGNHSGRKGPSSIQYLYMGRLIAQGGGGLVNKYDLKKRAYLGTTSMDAKLSLVMANQALAAPGKLVYDPFVGTGSFLFTCSHFGAYTLGSDIDGRQIRGKEETSIKSNIEQYNLQGRVLDSLVFDVCHHPWRRQAWLDAIVTAPYGVRAGAKRIGRKDDDKNVAAETEEKAPLARDRYPSTKPYEMSEVLADLLVFAAEHLCVGGRLVYWLPTVVDEYSNNDVPEHPCMELISNSEQNFGLWSRRLITMQKTHAWDPTQHVKNGSPTGTPELGHAEFRKKYFNRFQ